MKFFPCLSSFMFRTNLPLKIIWSIRKLFFCWSLCISWHKMFLKHPENFFYIPYFLGNKSHLEYPVFLGNWRCALWIRLYSLSFMIKFWVVFTIFRALKVGFNLVHLIFWCALCKEMKAIKIIYWCCVLYSNALHSPKNTVFLVFAKFLNRLLGQKFYNQFSIKIF